MADDLINALQTANRSASVLQGIANPPQINPLAAITAGNQAAQSEFQTRGLQAQQAIGQILQQSTDENGNVDYQKAHGLAARAGPLVQMGMTKFSQDASALKGAQLEQASVAHTLNSRLAANGIEDSSDANWANIRAQAVNANAPPQVIAEIDRIRGLPEGQRSGVAIQHLKNNLGALDQIQQIQGRRTTVSTPGATYNFTEPPPGRGMVTIPHGPDPGAVQEGGRLVDPEGRPVSPNPDGSIPPNARWQPTVTPKTQMPQFPQGGPPVTTPEGGGGGPPPVPSAPIPGGYQPRPAPRTATQPPPAPIAPSGGGNAPPVPPRPPGGDPNAPVPIPPPAATTPVPPPAPTAAIPTKPPQGQPEELAANQEAYRADQATIPATMTSAQNAGKAYEALRLLKEMNSTTGVGAAAINTVRSRLTTLGLTGAESMKVQQLQEEFGKYTEKLMLDAAGGASTNLGKTMAEKSNPGNLLSMAANFDVLRGDLGKTLQAAAAHLSHEDKSGGGYLGHRSDVATKTDPRGFVWNAYDDTEKAKIMADAQRDGAEAVKRLKRAIGLSHQFNLSVPGATQPPPSDKRSFLLPLPTPARNSLAMVG